MCHPSVCPCMPPDRRAASCHACTPNELHAPACFAACRLQVVCFVCKRFRQLCMAPELLRLVQLATLGAVAPRCGSLQQFLSRHAQHVRRLTLHLAPINELVPPLLGALPGLDDEKQQLQAALAVCLAACGAASSSGSGLEELVLSAGTPVPPAAVWLPPLARLQVLWLGQERCALELPPSISGLTSLRELGLRAREWAGAGPPLLPLSLTRLHVCGRAADSLLQSQVGS